MQASKYSCPLAEVPPSLLVHKAFWMERGGKAGLDSISCLAGTLVWPVAHSADSHTPSGCVQVGDTEFLHPQGHGSTGWCRRCLAQNGRDHTPSAKAGRETDGRRTKVEVLLECHRWRDQGGRKGQWGQEGQGEPL